MSDVGFGIAPPGTAVSRSCYWFGQISHVQIGQANAGPKNSSMTVLTIWRKDQSTASRLESPRTDSEGLHTFETHLKAALQQWQSKHRDVVETLNLMSFGRIASGARPGETMYDDLNNTVSCDFRLWSGRAASSSPTTSATLAELKSNRWSTKEDGQEIQFSFLAGAEYRATIQGKPIQIGTYDVEDNSVVVRYVSDGRCTSTGGPGVTIPAGAGECQQRFELEGNRLWWLKFMEHSGWTRGRDFLVKTR